MPGFSKDLFQKPKNALESLGQRFQQGQARMGVVCPGCKRRVDEKELEQNLNVCPRCGHHGRISARRRLISVADPASFEELDAAITAADPLSFPGYPEKLTAAAKASGEQESVLTGEMALGGYRVACFAMEPAFMMGSLGGAAGEKLSRLFERATERRLPVVGFAASGGARMQEGILSLMQMAKVSFAVQRHSAAGNLYISVLTDPTTGGVTASFAMQADITLSEPGALICFAGPRVIEQTIRQKLPEGFQRAEFLLQHGFVDRIVARENLQKELTALIRLHAGEVEA